MTTDEGDWLPRGVVAHWSEPFEITFGARTTGYGDVKLQIGLRYLGSQEAAGPEDQYHLLELDPDVRPLELGKPHSRRLDARILDYSDRSLTIDAYDDDSAVVELIDEPITTKDGTSHKIHYYINGESHGWFTMNLRAGTRKVTLGHTGYLFPAPIHEVQAPTAAVETRLDEELPTSVMLQQALDRLMALKLQLPKLFELELVIANQLTAPPRFDEDLPRSTPAGDDPGLRVRTRRLLELLVYVGPVFARLAGMADPEGYLPALANDAVAETREIAGLYADALVAAFGPTVEPTAFNEAERRLAKFNDWIIGHYLRDKRGVPQLIQNVAQLEHEYIRAYWEGDAWQNRTAGFRTRGEQITKVLEYGFEPRRSVKLREQRDRLEQRWRDEDPDVLEDISHFYSELQLDTGLLTAMVLELQITMLAAALGDSLTNDVIDVLPGTTNRSRQAWNDVYRLHGLIDELTAAHDESDAKERGKLAQSALTNLSNALTAMKDHIDEFQTRLKWVNRINIAGKLLVIVAVAALTAGEAVVLLGPELAALGASGGYLLAGKLLVEGLVFTVTSRLGHRLLFGNVDQGRFVNELFWNTLTLGFLKVVNAGYTKLFTLPEDAGRMAKLSFGLGRATSAMISLHGFGELQYRISAGKWMSGDERVDAIFQNVALMVGLSAGHFIVGRTRPAKLAALGERITAVETMRNELKSKLETVSRGEASPAEIRKLFDDIEQLWAEELRLLADGAKKGLIGEAELASSLAEYRAHIASIELRLVQFGIKTTSGPSMFRPLVRGFVAFAPEGRAQLEKFYDPADPAMPGKSLTESKTMPGVLEGRLPTGEITYYVPEGTFPRGIETGKAAVAARDRAVVAVQSDPRAAEGMRRLEAGLATKAGRQLGARAIDEILAAVPVDHVPSFLNALADPAFTADLPYTFYTGFAGRGPAIDFARVYGGDVVVKLQKHFGWSAEFDQALDVGRLKLESAPTPHARDAVLAELKTATPEALDKLVIDAKAQLRQTVLDALGPAPHGTTSPDVQLVPRTQLGDPRSSAKVIVEHGKVVRVLVAEDASFSAVREEVRHVAQTRDPALKHLFAQLDLGKPYEQYTAREKLNAHKAEVQLELADKVSQVEALKSQEGPLAGEEIIRAYDDINALRGKQLELARISDADLRAKELPAILAEPAELHARKPLPPITIAPTWKGGTLGEFRTMLLSANPTLKLTYGEIEGYYNADRKAPGRLITQPKFDVPAQLGTLSDLLLTTTGTRAQATKASKLLISDTERVRIDKLLKQRDDARRRRNDALSVSDEATAKRWDQKVREASHELGERALDVWARQRAWQDNQAKPSLYYRADSSRSGDFDAIHRWTDATGVVVYLVGEGKGAGAALGGKWVYDSGRKTYQYAQQGSTPYFDAIAKHMATGPATSASGAAGSAKVAGRNLEQIRRTGFDLDGNKARIIYEKVQVPVKMENAPRMKLGERSAAERFEITPFQL